MYRLAREENKETTITFHDCGPSSIPDSEVIFELIVVGSWN